MLKSEYREVGCNGKELSYEPLLQSHHVLLPILAPTSHVATI